MLNAIRENILFLHRYFNGGKRIKIPADMRYADWKAVYIDKTKTLDDWRKAKDAEYKRQNVKESGALGNILNNVLC